MEIETQNIPTHEIFKIHVFDATGIVKKIYIFCANQKNASHLPELFSELELALHETNGVEYIFSEQLIHPDDSIRITKKKIVNELGVKNVSYNELYLFGFFQSSIDMKEIYQSVTENEKKELTHAHFSQLALNINVSADIISRIDLDQDVYSYDDCMELQPPENRAFINKPIGVQFHNKYDYMFSANPFHINPRNATLFEISTKNQLLAFENHLILTYGKMESNNIFVCEAAVVFEFAAKAGIEQDYVCELYYPGLYSENIKTAEQLNEEKAGLLKETADSLTASTLQFYKTVDVFHEIFWSKSAELKYTQRGISKYIIVMKSSKEDHPFPLEILFKNMHATKEMPFIKYNPGRGRENIYRLYSDRISKNGKKIPVLQESIIMKMKREIGKKRQISIYLQHKYNEKNYNVIVTFDSNAKIQIEGELSTPLLKSDFEEFISTALNPIILMAKDYLYSSGYTFHRFSTLNDEYIESCILKYVALLQVDKKVDLDKYAGCIRSVFDILSTDVSDKGAVMRFKRVENFKEMDQQQSLITETYQRTNNSFEVLQVLMDTYNISREEAEMRLATFSSEHEQLRGKFLENPGFPVVMKMIPFKNEVSVEIDEIVSINYIDILHVYIDSILRITQEIRRGDFILGNKVRKLCSKETKFKENDDAFGKENIVASSGIKNATELFAIQPIQFGKEDEVVDDDEEVRGMYFDDDFDYEQDEIAEDLEGIQEEKEEKEEEEEKEVEGGGKEEEGEEKQEEKQEGKGDEKYMANIDGTSLKYPNIFQRRMQERDPNLFFVETKGKFKLYSRTCPLKRQPVILTDAEKERIDRTNPDSYENAVKYGSDPKNPYWYICPRYWCLKTNSSISEEDVKAGKCGDVIPIDATTVPKGAYVYEFTDKDHIDQNGKYQKHIPSFLDSRLHPNGLCTPCCFKKAWDSKQHRELREKCSLDGTSSGPVETGEQKTNLFVMNAVTSPLEKNRWGFLPMAVQYFLETDNSLSVDKKRPSFIKSGAPCLLRYGVENSANQSFLACVAYYYAYKQDKDVPTIAQIRKILTDSITLDMFLKYNNGNLVSIFRPSVINQAEIDVDKHVNSEFAKTIDLHNDAQLDFLEETIASYNSFIAFLQNETSEIDHTYLWDIVSDRNPSLMRDGINLVILEVVNDDGTDNVQLVCPSNSYSSVAYNAVKETVVLIKNGEYYDPLHLFLLQGTSDILIKKAFVEHDAIRNVKRMLDLIKLSTNKYCHPLSSMPKVYEFEQNISASDTLRILRSHDYNIGSQIINYNKKVIGFCVNREEGQNFVLVPCFPSGILDGIKIRYMDDDGLWLDYVTTRDRLISIYNETNGKIKCLPKIKMMEDKLVVGFLTKTNQFVQIDPPSENIYEDGLAKVEHYDYPIKNKKSVDKTLALTKSPDSDRVRVIQNITIESQFYSVFRSVIRLELNEFENRAIRKQIHELLDSNAVLYAAKLIKIDKLLRDLTKDSVTFQEFDQKTVDSFREIVACHQDEDGKCKNDKTKQYCLTNNAGGCKTLFPKRHLVSGADNEKIYFGRIADELIRYRRIRIFMFQTRNYLNITNAEYQIDSKELFILDSLLSKEYFKDLVPYITNAYIQNINYDDAQPENTQVYDNEISLTEQIALMESKDGKKTQLDEYISSCIKETKPRVVGNDKQGSWRPYFPVTTKEIVFMNTDVCSYIPIIYVLQNVLKQPISIQNIKTTLWNQYSKYMEVYRDKILTILRHQGKREFVDSILSKKYTFEEVLFSDTYYMTDLDIWVLCNAAQLPVILFSSTKLKYLLNTIDWLRLGSGKGGPNEKYYFIRSPLDVSPNKPPEYQLVSPSYSFSDMKNEMFLKADRGDPKYTENLLSLDDFFAKYHIIRR